MHEIFPAILLLETAFYKCVSREASMSAKYTPLHLMTGKGYMYYARATVEQYADSTVNNKIDQNVFVFFTDNESYPEYLITFQDIMI